MTSSSVKSPTTGLWASELGLIGEEYTPGDAVFVKLIDDGAWLWVVDVFELFTVDADDESIIRWRGMIPKL